MEDGDGVWVLARDGTAGVVGRDDMEIDRVWCADAEAVEVVEWLE